MNTPPTVQPSVIFQLDSITAMPIRNTTEKETSVFSTSSSTTEMKPTASSSTTTSIPDLITTTHSSVYHDEPHPMNPSTLFNKVEIFGLVGRNATCADMVIYYIM